MGWLVRTIFLPLNFSALAQLISRFRGQEQQLPAMPFDQAQYIVISMISAVMVAAIVPGYFFSSRLLGTHIRKVDATVSGWFATMACYPPLMQVVFLQWLNFYPHMDRAKWGTPWSVELAGLPTLAMGTGVLVIFLEALHYWGEASFGLRASNLSNRGIITNGLFRITKHPIYLVKCIIWFLWMPFLAGDSALHGAWLTLLWAGAGAIYGARAWAEERLLADDTDYVAYALWMDKHGLFRALSRHIPFFSFEWRLERWKNNDCCTA